ncbi:tartrate dehydrogenase [Pigmentiphaga sp. NML080357]|uniref:tartrate dehydrogenase n=1 Tax=Pigmentiphaga sp. NML080357 TaxID=2008675 RepID=UPI000B41917E|nr:tartrate dehydrogenase [Pigmentiphaga sp. NML080357]OVZ61289.1 tartrate dehydrogenase [Pigmentiphaga sp. NML080357]
MKPHRIAVIPGDGIGREVMPEGVRVLQAAAGRHGIALRFEHHDWGCHQYERLGGWMPPDWKERLAGCDAIYFGACGWPATVPDHVSLWDSLLKFRREFDQYVNLRPVRLMPGVDCPLRGRGPGDIDYWIVRENTEGEYSSVGGRLFEGTDREIACQQATFTRHGVDRVLRFAFELARRRPRRSIASATKSNGINITMPFWDERYAAMAARYPDVRASQYHVDAITIKMVLDPGRFDVIVASNLFGDILSDLGPATAGTIGIAPSANLDPERRFPSLFEPVHGSAPDIHGLGIANPIAQIWSGAMLLEHLGHAQAAQDVMAAIETVLAHGPRTPDLGGQARTTEVGAAVCRALAEQPVQA